MARGELTQKRLAKLSGVSQSMISGIESHDRPRPSALILGKLERALGVPHGYLSRTPAQDKSFERYLQSDYARDKAPRAPRPASGQPSALAVL